MIEKGDPESIKPEQATSVYFVYGERMGPESCVSWKSLVGLPNELSWRFTNEYQSSTASVETTKLVQYPAAIVSILPGISISFQNPSTM
jgi:hypothetical protein